MQRSGIWFKVKCEPFDPHLAYQAIGMYDYSESSDANIAFVLPGGQIWFAKHQDCTALMPEFYPTDWDQDRDDYFVRPLTDSERSQPWATDPRKPK